MQPHLDQTPPDGDFVAYIESLSSQVKPLPPVVLPAATAAPSRPHAAAAASQSLTKDLTPALQDIVAEVFKRRNAETRQTAVDKLDEIKRERAQKEPFTEPRDAWEARWQPVFQLVNQHRWLLIAIVFFAYAALSISKLVLLPLLGIGEATATYEMFGTEDLDEPLMWAFLISSAVLLAVLLLRLYHFTRQASEQHEAAPELFWFVIAALALFEWFMSSSSDVGSLLFWVSLVLGSISGALWRVVRGVRRGVLLMSNLRS
jgi:hypothetical protein